MNSITKASVKGGVCMFFFFEGWGAVVGTQCVMGHSGVNQVNVPV